MGLSQKKKIEFMSYFVETLKMYGVSMADFIYLPEAVSYIKEQKAKENPYKEFRLTEEEKKRIENINKTKLTPEKFMEQFAGDVEEFYPNGNGKVSK